MLLAQYLDAIENQGLWKPGLLGSFQNFRNGTAEHNWKQVKKIMDGDCSHLGPKVTSKITNVYGQYQQVKSHNWGEKRSSVGRLWTEEDLHCMKIDVFCADIADSLNKDARIQRMKTFHNWKKD
jgi:hypothetical protein